MSTFQNSLYTNWNNPWLELIRICILIITKNFSKSFSAEEAATTAEEVGEKISSGGEYITQFGKIFIFVGAVILLVSLLTSERKLLA